MRPGLLIAGKDSVAVDATSTAVMGFDPEAPSGSTPFVYADNHLTLASQVELGTNRLSDIGVQGIQVADARFPFRPVR